MDPQSLEVKIADTAAEFAQIARLNYATFVEEIPQHESNPDRALVDKFHAENRYFIVKRSGDIVGMLALRNQRPFSLDAKIPNLNDFVEPYNALCEIRLLAIEPSQRHSLVLRELFRAAFAHCVDQNYDGALISGRVEHIPLYRKLGFKAFAAPVGKPGAMYQPMMMTRATANRKLRAIPVATRLTTHNFLPGPVALHPSVQAAASEPAYSHRSARYLQLLADTKTELLKMTQTSAVEVFMGTGTLANDVVAAHIAQLGTPGLILSNGEFGERLVLHAQGFGVPHAVLKQPWGEALDLDALAQRLRQGDVHWLWCVHCETSTGRINDIAAIQALCDAHGVLLHIDGISSLGVVPCDWRGVRMATSVSGKALGGLTGMAMVFYDPAKLGTHSRSMPRYLDVRSYADKDGVPFSGSSTLLEALAAALRVQREVRAQERLALGQWLQARLALLQLPLVVDGPDRSPGVFTLRLPAPMSSRATGDALEASGLSCNYASSYLLQRNWLQICLMGEVSREGLELLCDRLASLTVGPTVA